MVKHQNLISRRCYLCLLSVGSMAAFGLLVLIYSNVYNEPPLLQKAFALVTDSPVFTVQHFQNMDTLSERICRPAAEQLTREFYIKPHDNSTHAQIRKNRNPQPFTSMQGSLEMTSSKTSKFSLSGSESAEHQNIHQGENIHVEIQTYDQKGRKRAIGGDFFFAVMSDLQLRKSTAGKVTDHGNGTYSVYFYAGWSGSASISVQLVHPREAVLWIRKVFRNIERRIDWLGRFGNGTYTEESKCYVSEGNFWKNKCEYGNEKALGNTMFLCEKPKFLACQQLAITRSQGQTLDSYAKAYLPAEKEVFFHSEYLVQFLSRDPLQITIKGHNSSHIAEDVLPSCGADLPVASSSDGFWENDTTWTSRVCKARHWSPDEVRTCLREKSVYFLGDSTLRQWHDVFRKILGQPLKGDRLHRNLEIPSQNISATFIFHAILIGSVDVHFWSQKFESDIVDDITEKQCNSVIVLSLTYHFASWTTASYVERLLHVRQALHRLKVRCPDIVIVIKGSHPREHHTSMSYIHSSDWILFDMNNMSRKIFHGLGIRFIDVYDMSLSHFAANSVHMPLGTVMRQQVDLFLSYVC
ncbi:NXPE family member 4-like isoform X1 [Ptychodera flava]|uniref:NXPE family member 4-like isoform X1 n=1 Tax=Ptychodera flava TaxID=63121 RepID=UPI00396A3C7E